MTRKGRIHFIGAISVTLCMVILIFGARVAVGSTLPSPTQPVATNAPRFTFQDGLVVGVDSEAVGNVSMAGAVHAIPGSNAGLTATGSQFWTQDSPGIPENAEKGDFFGNALAAGDFNGDGYPDLAIGAYGETPAGGKKGGAVIVLYGSATGVGQRSELWDQNSPGVLDSVEDYDSFGEALAAGDFNGDGYTDLAISNPSEGFQADNADALGVVHILYGSAQGLTATGNQMWHQDSPGMLGEASDGDFFGDALASGDFNGDGYADLAIGIRGEEVTGEPNAGAVQVIYGSAQGLTATGNQLFNQSDNGISGQPKEDVDFGEALAVGDFDGDGYDDLAIGAHNEDAGKVSEAGVVHVLYGSSKGLATPDQRWTQDTGSLPDRAEEDEEFGYALAAGDFDGDGYDDLAVGVRDEEMNSVNDTGAVIIIYGTDQGLTDSGSQLWYQGSPGLNNDGAEANDSFGQSLAAGDFNWDGYDDLAVGVPYEDLGNTQNAGAVQVIYGSTQGLTAQNNQWWTQDSPGIEDQAEEWDSFGSVLAVLPRLACADAYEPNDNFSQASSITPGTTLRAAICSDQDIDYFKFNVSAGQRIIIDLTNIPANTDYDLWLSDPGQNQVATSTNSGNADERIEHVATGSGFYYVTVTSYAGFSANQTYSLTIALSGGAAPPTPSRHIYLPIIRRQ